MFQTTNQLVTSPVLQGKGIASAAVPLFPSNPTSGDSICLIPCSPKGVPHDTPPTACSEPRTWRWASNLPPASCKQWGPEHMGPAGHPSNPTKTAIKQMAHQTGQLRLRSFKTHVRIWNCQISQAIHACIKKTKNTTAENHVPTSQHDQGKLFNHNTNLFSLKIGYP